jgi:hypothetical protein
VRKQKKLAFVDGQRQGTFSIWGGSKLDNQKVLDSGIKPAFYFVAS